MRAFESGKDKLVNAGYRMASILVLLSLLFGACGANQWKYNVLLVVSTNEFQPKMTWWEIRELGLKKDQTMRVLDTDGHPVPLFRFMHSSERIIPLDETEIHISTPIIVEKKYKAVLLSVLDNNQEITRVRVEINRLKPIKDEPKRFVVPIEIPAKRSGK